MNSKSKSKHLRAKDMRQAGTSRMNRNIDALGLRIQRHMQYVEKQEEFQAQHGAVKILMKDFQPVK